MMELQSLQEALKVEIQVHQKLVAQMKQDPQNADLKKQLHELQAKITALSEKQKKVVEQLRKDLMVKQEPELKLQLQTQTALPLQTPLQNQTALPLQLQTQIADTKHLQLQLTATPAQQPTPPHNTGVQQKTLTVTPLLTTKSLPLVLKAATTMSPAAAMPVMPAAAGVPGQCPPTLAMVTTALGGVPVKPMANSDSPVTATPTPINLHVATGKLTGQHSDPLRIIAKNAIVVQAATTTTSAQPIKVPQFVPPARATPRPAYLPQVRPKPPASNNNVPIAPAPAPTSAPPPPMVAAPAQMLQRPIMLATKLSPTSLSQTTTPIHQVRIVNGQTCAALATKSPPSGQVTGIVTISAQPAPQLHISSLPTNTKTVKSQERAVPVRGTTPRSSTPPPAAKPRREENPQKLAFMVSLGLVTYDHLEEIQSRRQERKRRTTANPVYSGAVFEPERKKSAVTYLNTPLHQGTRKRGRPPKYSSSGVEPSAAPPPIRPPTCGPPASLTPERLDPGGLPFPAHPHTLPLPPPPSTGDGDLHEDFCAVCRRSGQLLMCDTCSRVYHLPCLDPPLKHIPKGMWICPQCHDQILKKEDAIPWPGTLAIVHSYIAYKEAKEEEKQKLLKWSAELKLDREQLEQRVKQLTNSITKCMETKNTILARQKEMQAALEKVKHLICLIQSFERSQTALQPEPEPAPAPSQPSQAEEPSKAVAPEVKMDVATLEVNMEVASGTGMEVASEITSSEAAIVVDSEVNSDVAMEISTEVVSQVSTEVVAEVSMEVASEDKTEVLVSSGVDLVTASGVAMETVSAVVMEVTPGVAIEDASSVVMEFTSEVNMEDVSQTDSAEPTSRAEPGSEATTRAQVEPPGSEVGSVPELQLVESEASSEAESGSKLPPGTEVKAGAEVEADASSEQQGSAADPQTSVTSTEPIKVSTNGETGPHIESSVNSHSGAVTPEAAAPPLPSCSPEKVDCVGLGEGIENSDQNSSSNGKTSQQLPELPQNQAESLK